MKVKKEIDILIKKNYIGSMVTFSDDVGRFFYIKRLIRKHLTKNTFIEVDMVFKGLVNNIITLKYIFKSDITYTVFKEILEPDELQIYHSILYIIGAVNFSTNKSLEEKLREKL